MGIKDCSAGARSISLTSHWMKVDFPTWTAPTTMTTPGAPVNALRKLCSDFGIWISIEGLSSFGGPAVTPSGSATDMYTPRLQQCYILCLACSPR